MYARWFVSLIFLYMLAFIAEPASSLAITEIMFNPSGSDKNREWVEIYNNDSVVWNMTGWKLNTAGVDHSLNQNGSNFILFPGNFSVIAQDADSFRIDYPNFTGTFIDSSWSDLSNSVPKPVWLKNSTATLDNVTYSLAAEGNSSCLVNGSFVDCKPTPGAVNALTDAPANVSAAADASFSFLIGSAIVNATHALFRINLTGKDCGRLDNVTMLYNISSFISNFSLELGCNASAGSWIPVAAGNYTLCGLLVNDSFSDSNFSNNEACKTISASEAVKQCSTSVSISSDSAVNAGSQMNFNLVLSDSLCNESSVDVEYWIEDFFGSYVKNKLNTTQEFTCSKSVSRQWTPDTVDGTEGYKIKAVLKTKCPDLNASDNSAEKIIVVKGSAVSAATSSAGSSVPAFTTISIVSYPPRIFAGEMFETIANISVNASSVYSYIYSGNTPVTEWGGKKTWDANRRDAVGGLNALPIRIENGTSPGNYTMKIKAKGEKDYEAAVIVEILERPQLTVEELNGSFIISTECPDCEILVIGKDFEAAGGNLALENPGNYHVILMKNSRIFERRAVNVEEKPVEFNLSQTAVPVTGRTAAKSAAKKGVGGKIDYVILAHLLAKIKMF